MKKIIKQPLFLSLILPMVLSACSASYQHPVHGKVSEKSEVYQTAQKKCDLKVFTKDGIRLKEKGYSKEEKVITFTGITQASNYTLSTMLTEMSVARYGGGPIGKSKGVDIFAALFPYMSEHSTCMEQEGFTRNK